MHSLRANEQPVQPYPWQQQHQDTDGDTEKEPVSKVDLVAVWVKPETELPLQKIQVHNMDDESI